MTTVIYFAVTRAPDGTLRVATTLDGLQSHADGPAQALAHAAASAFAKHAPLDFGARHVPALALALDLVDTERYAHAVTAEVRCLARAVLVATGAKEATHG